VDPVGLTSVGHVLDDVGMMELRQYRGFPLEPRGRRDGEGTQDLDRHVHLARVVEGLENRAHSTLGRLGEQLETSSDPFAGLGHEAMIAEEC
jgi:hypothetical protein